jgi:hypothetical protein
MKVSDVGILLNTDIYNIKNCVWYSCVKHTENLEDLRSEKLPDIVIVP